MPPRNRPLTAAVLLAAIFVAVNPAAGQSPTTKPLREPLWQASAIFSHARPGLTMVRSAHPLDAAASDSTATAAGLRVVAARRRRGGHTEGGALIGAVVGIVACNVFASGISDRGSASCPLMGNVALGVVGAILGGFIGSQIR